MTLHRWLAMVPVLAWLAVAAAAADLTKIERTLAKEPAYQSKTPKYCLMVFGPEAKTRVWLVLDGDTLYVDRNGNGDLTEPDEKVALPAFTASPEGPIDGNRQAKAGKISTGPKTGGELMLMQYRLRKDFKPKAPGEEDIVKLLGSPSDGMVTGIILYADLQDAKKLKDPGPEALVEMAMADDQGALQFGEGPGKAPILHFNGPLKLAVQPAQRLVGGEESRLVANLGTPGLGKGTFIMRGYQGIPEDVHPVADLEFPAKESGKPPIKLRVTLSKRC